MRTIRRSAQVIALRRRFYAAQSAEPNRHGRRALAKITRALTNAEVAQARARARRS